MAKKQIVILSIFGVLVFGMGIASIIVAIVRTGGPNLPARNDIPPPPPSPSKTSPVADIVGKVADTDLSKVTDTQFILSKGGTMLALSVGKDVPPPPSPPAAPLLSSGMSGRAHVARSYASAFWGADWKDMFPEAQEEMNKLNTRVQGVETRVENIETTTTDLQDRVKNLENTTLPALEKRLGDQIAQSRLDIKSDLDSRDKAMANALGSIADTLKQVSGKLDTQSQKIEDRMSRGDTAVANLKGQLDVLLRQNTAPAPQPSSPQGPPASSP